MPTCRPSLRFAFPLLALTTLGACSNAVAGDGNASLNGGTVSLGAGTLHSYLVMHDGAVSELGVAIDSAAMATLPATGPGHGDATMLLLPLPAEANTTPYRLLEVDWNPHGHEPPGVYDQPHFDVHFYTITQAERDAIVPSDPQFDQKAANHPAADELPAGYVPIPGAVPQMGVHWVDSAAPELHGQLFTHTLIYGSWDGRVTFVEPMVTRAFLESRADFTAPIPAPESVAVAGNYPTVQHIYWNPPTHEFRVALTGFAARS